MYAYMFQNAISCSSHPSTGLKESSSTVKMTPRSRSVLHTSTIRKVRERYLQLSVASTSLSFLLGGLPRVELEGDVHFVVELDALIAVGGSDKNKTRT